MLLGDVALTVTGAMMSNRAAGLTIEDHAVMLMQVAAPVAWSKPGYLYPAPNSVFDMHYSIRTEKHYFAARDNGMLEIVTNDRDPDDAGDEADERVLLPRIRARYAASGARRSARRSPT